MYLRRRRLLRHLEERSSLTGTMLLHQLRSEGTRDCNHRKGSEKSIVQVLSEDKLLVGRRYVCIQPYNHRKAKSDNTDHYYPLHNL